jgi:DNA-binding MarR family transcriptional regulator
MRITDEDYRTLASFRRGMREFIAFSQAQAQAVGLTSRQHQALLAIRGRPARKLTVGELAAELLIKPHSALALANRLVASGLARRKPDAADRRRVTLLLTPEGERLLASLSERHLTELARQRSLLRGLMRHLSARPHGSRRTDPAGRKPADLVEAGTGAGRRKR